jgi:hypothetical protein
MKPPNIVKTLIQHDPQYIVEGENEKMIRRIYNNVEYNDFEKDLIKRLESEIKT